MRKLTKSPVSEHLKRWLKSSYLERLNWLEEANRFALLALAGQPKKLRTNSSK